MINTIETTITKVTIFEYQVYDQKGYQGHEYDATPEQCYHKLWKKHPSAHITEMFEIYIGEKPPRKIDKVELKKIVNPYAQGHDEDMNRHTLMLKEIADFKKKKNIE